MEAKSTMNLRNKPPTVEPYLASKKSPVDNPPMFIVVGSDDNTNPAAINWIRSVMENGRNFDGSRRFMSFYVNTGQTCALWSRNTTLVNAAYDAYKAGHEIANHTEDHLYCIAPNGKREDVETIENAIRKTQQALITAGIPKEHHFGFRTPYLTYSDNTFIAMRKVMQDNREQLLYDCSINGMYDKGGPNWPYTLDGPADENGNVAPDNDPKVNEWGTDNPVKKHERIWELPARKIAIDPKDCPYVEDILKKKYGKDFKWDKHIVGLDYNLWNEAELNSDQTTRAYMHTLKKLLKGNRAPFTMGVHSQFYFEGRPGLYPKIADPAEKRRSFAEFVEQASKIPNVFFVSGDMVIRWMLNPVSADKFNPENYCRYAFNDVTPPTNILLSDERINEKEFEYGKREVGFLRAVNLNKKITHYFQFLKGGNLFEVANDNVLRFKSPQKTGVYDITLKTVPSSGYKAYSQDFKIYVDPFYDTDVCMIKNKDDWQEAADSYNIGSLAKIKSKTPLQAEISVGVNKSQGGKILWPYSGVAKLLNNPLTGLSEISITYSCDNPINLDIANRCEGLEFGFSAPLPATDGEEKTVKVTLDMFITAYTDSNDENKDKIPGSVKQALNFENNFIRISGCEEGSTTNVCVKSLKFKGIAGNKD